MVTVAMAVAPIQTTNSHYFSVCLMLSKKDVVPNVAGPFAALAFVSLRCYFNDDWKGPKPEVRGSEC